MTSLPKSKVLQTAEAQEPAGVSNEDRIKERSKILDQNKARPTETLKIRPINVFGDFVAVIPVAESEYTQGGIAKPDAVRETPSLGVILGIGQQAADWLGVNQSDIIGKCIKFGVRGPIQLDEGDIPYYDSYTVRLVNVKNVFCQVPDRVAVEIEDGSLV